MKILILTQDEIKKIITMKEAIDVVEKVFSYQAEGLTVMPEKIYLTLSEYNGDFRAMPAYIKPLNICGIKWVCSYPDNKKYNLPTVMAILILNDPKTAQPLAILDATYITNLRTGAAGAVAVKYLVNREVDTISFIGCGKQAEFQFLAIKEIKKFNTVKVYDVNLQTVQRFTNFVHSYGYKVFITKNVKECVFDADIVCTTTPSKKPVVKLEWLKKPVHINAIGADAPGKQELEISILKNSTIVVDNYEQAMHSGEVNVAVKKGIITKKDIFAELGEIVSGKKKLKKDKQITIFDSTGLAIQDVAVGWYIYRKARKSDAGSVLDFKMKDIL